MLSVQTCTTSEKEEKPLFERLVFGLSIGGIAGGWIAYDALCRSPLGRDTRGLVIAGFAFIVFLALGSESTSRTEQRSDSLVLR